MGTADLACASLEALAKRPGFQIVAVVSQPDKPRGREMRLHPTPVKELAESLSLTILQPDKARHPDFVETLRSLKPDLIAVAAYGQILPKSILEIPSHGCLNVHTSLLPKYRGAAPIQWAIIDGEHETGVTIMKMDAGLDTGDILAQQRTPIDPKDDAQTLHDRLATLGGNLLVRTIPQWVAGDIKPIPQLAEGMSYARKITKEDGRLDWNLPARVLWNRIRGFTPWPGAYTHFSPGGIKPVLLKIWQAEPVLLHGKPGNVLAVDESGIIVGCGENSLRILALQKEGGKRMAAADFLMGHKLQAGTQLGSGEPPA